jgi:hypothetical protein
VSLQIGATTATATLSGTCPGSYVIVSNQIPPDQVGHTPPSGQVRIGVAALPGGVVDLPTCGAYQLDVAELNTPPDTPAHPYADVIGSGKQGALATCGPTTVIDQRIAGDIYLCASGAPTTTLAPSAGASLSVPDSLMKRGGLGGAGGHAGQPTEVPVASALGTRLGVTSENAGTWTMSAVAPTGYIVVPCAQSGASVESLSARALLAQGAATVNSQSGLTVVGGRETIDAGGAGATEQVTVPAGGEGVGIFYVTKSATSTSTTSTSTTSTSTTSTTAPCGPASAAAVNAAADTSTTSCATAATSTTLGATSTTAIAVSSTSGSGLAFTGVQLYSELAIVAGLIGLGFLTVRSSRLRKRDVD